MEILIYIILGLFVGVLAGVFGIGGGVIIVPALLFVLTYLGYESDLLIHICVCLLYTSPSPRDPKTSRMPSSA